MTFYIDVVKEQLHQLEKGLLPLTKKLIVFVTNYDKHNCSELDKLLTNDKFIVITSPENVYEKFAINNYKKYIDEPNYYLYYFHTKGLSRGKNTIFSSRRKILNYYTLEKFNVNIKLLESYDAVGCSLTLYPSKHFSGNFWWSKSSYLNTLMDVNDKYLAPEMYILSNPHCKCISLSNNTNNLLMHQFDYPCDSAIEKSKTNVFINNLIRPSRWSLFNL